jgi:hypothetical protein
MSTETPETRPAALEALVETAGGTVDNHTVTITTDQLLALVDRLNRAAIQVWAEQLASTNAPAPADG